MTTQDWPFQLLGDVLRQTSKLESCQLPYCLVDEGNAGEVYYWAGNQFEDIKKLEQSTTKHLM